LNCFCRGGFGVDYGAIASMVALRLASGMPDSGPWEGRGGTSAEVRSLGLRPAFRFRPTGEVFFDPEASTHLPHTVPAELWAEVDSESDLRRFVSGVEQGFVFPDEPGRFFTRAEAAEMLALSNPRGRRSIA
jgi:hypothetical protein